MGGRYPNAWCGLMKLYSMSHSVRFRLNSVESAVMWPRLRNSSWRVRLNRSFTALSLGVLARDHAGIERVTKWGGYRELHFDGARLCITNYGIGVWHIRDAMQFTGLTDLAYWRRDEFRSILRGEHPIGSHTSKLILKERTHTHGILESYIGRLEYALSVFALKQHGWTSKQLRPALKLVSCPRILLPSDQSKHDRSGGRTQRYFDPGGEIHRTGKIRVKPTQFGNS